MAPAARSSDGFRKAAFYPTKTPQWSFQRPIDIVFNTNLHVVSPPLS
jgi:hypothetical protein